MRRVTRAASAAAVLAMQAVKLARCSMVGMKGRLTTLQLDAHLQAWVVLLHRALLVRTPAHYLGETARQSHTTNYPARRLLPWSLQKAKLALTFCFQPVPVGGALLLFHLHDSRTPVSSDAGNRTGAFMLSSS